MGRVPTLSERAPDFKSRFLPAAQWWRPTKIHARCEDQGGRPFNFTLAPVSRKLGGDKGYGSDARSGRVATRYDNPPRRLRIHLNRRLKQWLSYLRNSEKWIFGS